MSLTIVRCDGGCGATFQLTARGRGVAGTMYNICSMPSDWFVCREDPGCDDNDNKFIYCPSCIELILAGTKQVK